MELNIKFDEKMLVETANRVLDEFEYNGKTIREWADLIANPKTNADRIRSMSDEELAEFMNHGACPPGEDVSELCYNEDRGSVTDMCNRCWLNWLRQEGE